MTRDEILMLDSRAKNRHIFSSHRVHMCRYVAPIYVAFGALDYIYSPEHFNFWFSMRIVFFIYCQVMLQFLRKKSIRDKYSVPAKDEQL
jgi:hypothetical protein